MGGGLFYNRTRWHYYWSPCRRRGDFRTTCRLSSSAMTRSRSSSSERHAYGLAAYVHTCDLDRAFHLAEGLEYGVVGLNDRLASVHTTFGGSGKAVRS